MNKVKCRVWHKYEDRYCKLNEINLSIDDFGELYVWRDLLDQEDTYMIEFATSHQYLNGEDVYIGDVFIGGRGIAIVVELYGTQFYVEKLEEFIDIPELSASFLFGKKLGTIHDIFPKGFCKQEYDKFIDYTNNK